MRDAVQHILHELTAKSDSRITVVDLHIDKLESHTLSLSGRLLSQGQLAAVKDAFSDGRPDLSLDTSAIRILQRPDLPCMHVSTNLTGLYEKPTFAVPLLGELCFGTCLEMLEENDRWVFTRQADGYLGWAYRPYLAAGSIAAVTHLVMAPAIELRAEPDSWSAILTRLVSGTGVSVIEETRQGWAHVEANQTGWLPAALLRSVDNFPKTAEARGAMIVEDSRRMIGTPYLWGGTSGNGIDCSGFARLLHRWIGIEIPRDADMQRNAARPVEPPFEAGDLFFFGEAGSDRQVTHVGISIGGWRMIHSSRSRNGVYIDNIQESESLREIYISAGTFVR